MKRIIPLAAALLLLSCGAAFAGGITLYEIGTADLGTAYAGAAARAEDAATAFTNPAGMTRLQQNQVIFGAQPMLIQTKFSADSSTTYGGGDGGDAGSLMPSGGFYSVFALNEDARLGMTVNSFAGLGLDYDDGWSGRYYTQESSLYTYNFNPSAAYRVNEWLSVGAGLNVIVAQQTMKMAFNNVAAGGAGPDGSIKYDADTAGVGGTFGLFLEPAEALRLGLTYRTPIELDFRNHAHTSGIDPTLLGQVVVDSLRNAVHTKLTLPQQVMASAVYNLTGGLDLLANLGWEQYSEFAKSMIRVKVLTEDVTEGRDYDDTWHAGIGARYALNERWKVSAGFSYDSSMADTDVRTPDLPADRVYRYAGGVNYAWDTFSLGLNYEYADLGSAPIDKTSALTGTLKGDYDTNCIHFLALTGEWKF
jgi:long-chain fatty acid transport protein